MSLTSALNIAQNALLNTSRQTNTVSRNITGAGDENYSHRQANTETASNGARIINIRRTEDLHLMRKNLEALSSYEGQQTLSTQLNDIKAMLSGPDNQFSLENYLAGFRDRLQEFSAAPANGLLAEAAVDSAKQLAVRLNETSSQIQAFRDYADQSIAGDVAKVNDLLTQLESANSDVVAGNRVGRPDNDALDRRDTILKDIAKILPISILNRADSDIVVTTVSGATLFEKVPREVTFQSSVPYGPGTTGNQVRVDGVPVPAGTGSNTAASGTIAAMLQFRDDIAVNLQGQADEIARGMVDAFAERDPTGGPLPALAGLFQTSAGVTAVPAAGVMVPGLSSTIVVAAAFDLQAGGDPNLLRDGGANGAGYVANPTGAEGFSTSILGYAQRLESPMAFDGAAGIPGSTSLMSYAADSIGWLEGARSTADTATGDKKALFLRTSEVLSNRTGVNVDEEMSMLLDLEHSYEASARLIGIVDQMLNSLMLELR